MTIGHHVKAVDRLTFGPFAVSFFFGHENEAQLFLFLIFLFWPRRCRCGPALFIRGLRPWAWNLGPWAWTTNKCCSTNAKSSQRARTRYNVHKIDENAAICKIACGFPIITQKASDERQTDRENNRFRACPVSRFQGFLNLIFVIRAAGSNGS